MTFCQKRRVNSFGKKTQLYYYTRSIFFYYDLEMIVFFLQHRQSFWAFEKKKINHIFDQNHGLPTSLERSISLL